MERCFHAGPNRSPLGASRSNSGVSGSWPLGPAAVVCTSKRVGSLSSRFWSDDGIRWHPIRIIVSRSDQSGGIEFTRIRSSATPFSLLEPTLPGQLRKKSRANKPPRRVLYPQSPPLLWFDGEGTGDPRGGRRASCPFISHVRIVTRSWPSAAARPGPRSMRRSCGAGASAGTGSGLRLKTINTLPDAEHDPHAPSMRPEFVELMSGVCRCCADAQPASDGWVAAGFYSTRFGAIMAAVALDGT